MIDFVQDSDIYKLAVKQVGKPAVYVSHGLEMNNELDERIWSFVKESMQKIYKDDPDKLNEIILGLICGGLFFFETENEQNEFYHVFEQPLTDSSAIYACTYNQNGECLTENT